MKKPTILDDCNNPKCPGKEFEVHSDFHIECTTCLQEFGYCRVCGEWQPVEVLQGAPASVYMVRGFECKKGCEDIGFEY